MSKNIAFNISLPVALIGVSLIGIAIMLEHGKEAVALIWFPCVIAIAIMSLRLSIKQYKKANK